MNDRLDDLMSDDATFEARSSVSLLEKKETPTKEPKKKKGTKKTTKQKLRSLKSKMLGKHRIKQVIEREAVMKSFFQNVETIQTKVATIPSATKELKTMTERIIFGTMSSQEEKQLDSRACEVVQQTNQTSQAIRSSLKAIQQETKQLEGHEGLLTEGDLRVRHNMTSSVTRKFINDLRFYQEAQSNYKTKTTKRFQRQIQNVDPTITDEQVNLLVQNGETDRDALYQELILDKNKVSQRIQSIHAKVSEKHQAILQIEQSVAMVHQLFLDFAVLTEEQGLTLDRIEYDVKRAVDYVEEGNENVYDAVQYSKKIRRKKLKLIALTAGVALVIILVVVL